MDNHQFIEKAWAAATAIKERGAAVSVPIVVAQAALESNYGRSRLSTECNNLFGIKGEYKGRSKAYNTMEQNTDGTWYETSAKFRLYPDWEDCFDDYAGIIERLPWYADASDAAHSPKDFLRGILAKVDETGRVYEPGWATDHNYYNKVWNIVLENGLLERQEQDPEQEFVLLQVYDGERRLDFEPIKLTMGTLNNSIEPKLMVRVKETTFWQRLRYLFS